MSGRVDPQKTRVGSRVNPFLLRVKKKKKSGSGRVFFESGQKILTRFAMSRCDPFRFAVLNKITFWVHCSIVLLIWSIMKTKDFIMRLMLEFSKYTKFQAQTIIHDIRATSNIQNMYKMTLAFEIYFYCYNFKK